jgi:hypothetical protein
MAPSIRSAAICVSAIACAVCFVRIPRADARLAGTGELIKGSGPAVYFFNDGKRHPFPNESIFKQWGVYAMDDVRLVKDGSLSATPLGINVTYPPGTLVKLTTDPKVYAVDRNNALRWITTEEIAKKLYGDSWNTRVHDISDAFFVDYGEGGPITDASLFNPAWEIGDSPSFLDVIIRLKTAAKARPSIDAFLHPDGLLNPKTDGYGYAATSTRTPKDACDWFKEQSSGWTLQFDYATSSVVGTASPSSAGFGDFILLNFSQARGRTFAHRSVACYGDAFSAGATKIVFTEIEYPEGSIVFPYAASVFSDFEDADWTRFALTDRSEKEVEDWYARAGGAAGWAAPESVELGSVSIKRMEQSAAKRVMRFIPPSKPSDLNFWLSVAPSSRSADVILFIVGANVHALIEDFGPGLE